MKRDQNGFTLIELVIVISIMAILLGVLIPSFNSILGFEAQKATKNIEAALSKTKVEAMNRLVGEMKLEYREDGYYITYYLDRGEESRSRSSLADQEIKIANAKVNISYQLSDGIEVNMKEAVKSSLILTYNRDTGAFRPVQTDVLSPQAVQKAIDDVTNIPFLDSGKQCEWIKIQCGFRTRTIVLHQESGSYTVESN